jgi:hypothetical protein
MSQHASIPARTRLDLSAAVTASRRVPVGRGGLRSDRPDNGERPFQTRLDSSAERTVLDIAIRGEPLVR